MDIGAYRRARVLEEAEDLARKWDSKTRRFAVTPRFALSCSQDLLEGAGDLARRSRELGLADRVMPLSLLADEVLRRVRVEPAR